MAGILNAAIGYFKKVIFGRLQDVVSTGVDQLDMDGSRPSIVCVSHDAGFYGAQLLILHIARALREQHGFRVVTILLGDGPLENEFAQVGEVIDFTRPSWRQIPDDKTLLARRQAIKRLYERGFSYSICNTSICGPLVQLLKEEGFKVVTLVHELPFLIKSFRLESSVKQICQWSDSVVFPAEYVRDQFLTVSGVEPVRSEIRPQGLYRKNPYRDNRESARSQLRVNLGIQATDVIVMAAGNGDRRKGVDLFSRVASLVAQQMPNVHFVWIGDDAGELSQDCKAWLKVTGQEGHVHFLGVLQEPEAYLSHMAGADIYLMTSREDPFPTVVLDAMEVGMPVIGFDKAGGFMSLLEEGAGILVPYENTHIMAESVIRLASDKALMTEIGRASRRIIADRFLFEDYIYDLLKIVGCGRKKVSVIVPNYNYSRYLPDRLASILSQTYRPYEIIFLDDRSIDDSVRVAEEILVDSGLPYRIVANKVNCGCYSQWLSGIDMARGDLVWIAEADDLCESDFLSELVRGFDDSDVVLAYSQSRKIDSDGMVTRPNYYDYTNSISEDKWKKMYKRSGVEEIKDTLSIKNTIPNASGVLMKKPCLNGIRNQLVQMKNAGDWLTYVHVLRSGSVYYCPKVLNSHRVHMGSLTRGGNALQHMCEIIEVQEYVSSIMPLDSQTRQRIEDMRCFTYDYLKLNEGGVGYYRDHPDIRGVLNKYENPG